MERPEPRVALGLALRGVAHACADVSDGLLGDLGHILQASGLAAEVDVATLMASAAVSDDVRALPAGLAHTCVLAGGDDYELVFTAPRSARQAVRDAALTTGMAVTRLGRIVPAHGGACQARLVGVDGARYPLPADARLGGFDHFA
jgi:thiamine-monophosphate kinase